MVRSKEEVKAQIEALEKRIDEAIAWFEQDRSELDLYWSPEGDIETNNLFWRKFRSLLRLRASLHTEINKMTRTTTEALKLW